MWSRRRSWADYPVAPRDFPNGTATLLVERRHFRVVRAPGPRAGRVKISRSARSGALRDCWPPDWSITKRCHQDTAPSAGVSSPARTTRANSSGRAAPHRDHRLESPDEASAGPVAAAGLRRSPLSSVRGHLSPVCLSPEPVPSGPTRPVRAPASCAASPAAPAAELCRLAPRRAPRAGPPCAPPAGRRPRGPK